MGDVLNSEMAHFNTLIFPHQLKFIMDLMFLRISHMVREHFLKVTESWFLNIYYCVEDIHIASYCMKIHHMRPFSKQFLSKVLKKYDTIVRKYWIQPISFIKCCSDIFSVAMNMGNQAIDRKNDYSIWSWSNWFGFVLLDLLSRKVKSLFLRSISN